MCPYTVFQPMVNGPYMEVHGFHGAKRPLNVRELLATSHRVCGADALGNEAGADHIEPIERGLGGDVVVIECIGKSPGFDLEPEMLGHLGLVDDLANAYAIKDSLQQILNDDCLDDGIANDPRVRRGPMTTITAPVPISTPIRLLHLPQTFYRHPPHLLCQLNNYPTALCPNVTVSSVTILLSHPSSRSFDNHG